MATIVHRIVNGLTDAQRLQIISDHRAFERDGFIGDCLLRSTAQQIADTFGGFAGNAPIWMEQVANAAYRNFAERFIANMDDGK